MKLIPLTQGKFAKVDDADFDWLNRWSWCAQKLPKGKFYAARREGRRGPYIYMHRQIIGNPETPEVDHRDNDGLNNQRENLRAATSSQNKANRPKLVKSLSRYKGVSFNRQKYKNKVYFYWFSQIVCNKIHYHLGRFKTELEAALAYDKKARELFGEFAQVNFP